MEKTNFLAHSAPIIENCEVTSKKRFISGFTRTRTLLFWTPIPSLYHCVCNGPSRHCMFVDNEHRSHCTLLSVSQSVRTHDRSSAWLHALHCQISVHVQTSGVVVMAHRNLKLALLLAVVVSAAPTLFI